MSIHFSIVILRMYLNFSDAICTPFEISDNLRG